MAHRLMRNDWMFSAVTPPWHGIGTVTKSTRRAKEAIADSRLNWETIKEKLYRYKEFDLITLGDNEQRAAILLKQLSDLGVPITLGQIRELNAHRVTVRSDLPFENPASDLGVVGESYGVIQNEAAFDACDRLVGGLGAEYETAGSLMNGKRVFLLARVPVSLKIKDDALTPYILITTSHDGSTAMEVKFTTIRVVCWNTLSMALAEGKYATAYIKHSAGAVDKNGKVRQVVLDQTRVDMFASPSSDPTISFAQDYLREQTALFNSLADYKVTDNFVSDYFKVLIPESLHGERSTRSDNKRQTLFDIYYGKQPGNEQDAMKNTAYRLFNAVTHFNDHIVNPRQTTNKATGEKKTFAEARFNRIMNSGFREDAMNILCEAMDTNGRSLTDALDKFKAEKEENLRRKLVMN